MKKKISFIGHYSEDVRFYDGQSIKTKIFFDEIQATDFYDVDMIDTCKWSSKIFSLLKKCNYACRNDDYVVMMPGPSGFKALVRLLNIMSGKNRRCKLVYVVTGGWITELISRKSWYLKWLNKFDCVIVETQTLKTELENVGVETRLFVVPNFKRLDIVTSVAPVAKFPYRFCTFSRVMREKGISDAVECIKTINEKYSNTLVTLDIYGQIEENYQSEFEDLMKSVPRYIRYKGIVDFDKSVETLKDYYALLYPTRYDAECQSGTVIDAFASGLPVIAYDWRFGKDLIDNGVEGWRCKADVDELVKAVEFAINDQDMILTMRVNCVKKAQDFTPDVNIEKFVEILMKL